MSSTTRIETQETPQDLETDDGARAIVTDWLSSFDPPPRIDFQQSEVLQQLIRDAFDDYELVLADKRRLARDIDVALHGAGNAARQASLCDLVEPARALRKRATELEALLAETVRERENYNGMHQAAVMALTGALDYHDKAALNLREQERALETVSWSEHNQRLLTAAQFHETSAAVIRAAR